MPESASRSIIFTSPAPATLRGDTQIIAPFSSVAGVSASANWHVALMLSRPNLSSTLTLTRVPPLVGPLLGMVEAMCPARAYSNVTCPCTKSTPLLVTPTRTVPSPRSGAMHVILVDDVKTAGCTPSRPNRHARSSDRAKLCPAIVTLCPASTLPESPRDGFSPATTAASS